MTRASLITQLVAAMLKSKKAHLTSRSSARVQLPAIFVVIIILNHVCLRILHQNAASSETVCMRNHVAASCSSARVQLEVSAAACVP